jgi:hypothetical protein
MICDTYHQTTTGEDVATTDAEQVSGGTAHHVHNDSVSSRPKLVLIVVANLDRIGQSLRCPGRRLVTGQQQYSGRKVAQVVIDMLGV